MRCLIAEDEPGVLRMLVRFLAARGHSCMGTASAAELQRLSRQERPEVVLSDVGLGADDGIEACLRLKREQPSLRVLMMTGDPAHARRIEAAGLGPALRKPFTLTEFKEAAEPLGL
ncbi:MAG: response regulator [Elusimicrobia bacterium]|nr:response regulator [Elusimicrobiota bacterium]